MCLSCPRFSCYVSFGCYCSFFCTVLCVCLCYCLLFEVFCFCLLFVVLCSFPCLFPPPFFGVFVLLLFCLVCLAFACICVVFALCLYVGHRVCDCVVVPCSLNSFFFFFVCVLCCLRFMF